jgi:thiol-disulfide isomerase/thioredoxin
MIMRKSMLTLLALATALLSNAALAIDQFETDSLSDVIASQKGKPFVLIVWSLDCEYCQASLKTLREEKRKRKDFRIVTLATDSLDDPQAAALVQQRLAALGMNANAWAFGGAPAEQLRYAIDPKWHGEMPRSYWFNARGDKVAHSGVVTPELIARLAAPL